MNARYSCPTCGTSNRNRYVTCNHPICPDGRDQTPPEFEEDLLAMDYRNPRLITITPAHEKLINEQRAGFAIVAGIMIAGMITLLLVVTP